MAAAMMMLAVPVTEASSSSMLHPFKWSAFISYTFLLSIWRNLAPRYLNPRK